MAVLGSGKKRLISNESSIFLLRLKLKQDKKGKSQIFSIFVF